LNRNLAIGFIITAFFTGTFVSTTSALAEKGENPFAEIWEAIFGLQSDVDDLEKRVEALENPIPPLPPIVTNVIISQGTSVPGCESTNSCFIPFEAGVLVGSSLTWINADSAAHTVTSGNPNEGPSGEFDSSLIFSGNTFSHTFNSVGEIQYFCLVHPWMKGIVVVQ